MANEMGIAVERTSDNNLESSGDEVKFCMHPSIWTPSSFAFHLVFHSSSRQDSAHDADLIEG